MERNDHSHEADGGPAPPAAGATAGASDPAVELERAVRRFLDRDGRLKVWPSKLKDQKLALAWLTERFDPGRRYHEREVNERLNALHAFGDWALLRRAMFDYGYLDREADGSAYWRR
jgi:hypothetical protein